MSSFIWIIPDPDPKLKLTVDSIDPTTFNFDDIRWIYSSSMKKYNEATNSDHNHLLS